jgi:regulatory protein
MKDIYAALVRFCSYQERCRSDVINKMKQLNVSESQFEKWLLLLEKENFLNEKRFVKNFVNGRFKHKNWGISKIKRELAARQIDRELIEQTLAEEIEQEEYTDKLMQLAEKKWKNAKDTHPEMRRIKVQNYLLSKGFELPVVLKIMQSDIFR